jgi:hypothetical protein
LFANYRLTRAFVARIRGGLKLDFGSSAVFAVAGELGGLGSPQPNWSLKGGVAGAF